MPTVASHGSVDNWTVPSHHRQARLSTSVEMEGSECSSTAVDPDDYADFIPTENSIRISAQSSLTDIQSEDFDDDDRGVFIGDNYHYNDVSRSSHITLWKCTLNWTDRVSHGFSSNGTRVWGPMDM
jgi:hypothetical protein